MIFTWSVPKKSRRMSRGAISLEIGVPTGILVPDLHSQYKSTLSARFNTRLYYTAEQLSQCPQIEGYEYPRTFKTSRVLKQSRKIELLSCRNSWLPKTHSISLLKFYNMTKEMVSGEGMARHGGGWVKLHRKAALGDINSNFTRGGMFSALIAMANIQPSTIDWMGKPRTLKRGEIATSYHEIAELGGVDRKTIVKHLNYLRLRGTIMIEVSKNGIIISFVNYERYAGLDAEWSPQDLHAMDHGMDRSMDNGVPHNEELKNIRIKEYIQKPVLNLNWFNEIRNRYPTKVLGPKAEERFAEQIKTEEDFNQISKALTNYLVHLKQEEWKKPKQTLAAFLGTKSSGFFWRDWIDWTPTTKKNYENERQTDHDAEVAEAWRS